MGKANRLTTPIDLTKDLGIHKRKIYGQLRKGAQGGVALVEGAGGNFVQVTGMGGNTSLLASNNHWIGTNEFNTICIHKLTCDLDAGGKKITNVASPSQCGDVATKCYVDLALQTAGFQQGVIIENITDTPFVFYNPGSNVWTPYQNVYVYNIDIISEKYDSANSGEFFDFSITRMSGTDERVTNGVINGISLMPKSYWGNTVDWYVDNIHQGTVILDASGNFTFDFDQSGFSVGTHELEIKFGGVSCVNTFVV